MAAIEIENLKKSFRIYADRGQSLKEKLLSAERRRYQKRTVLDGISLTVEPGEAIGLVGKNGCGKSTLLKLMSRILYPDSGSVRLNGRVSSLIELGAGFHPDMTGRENIFTNASIFGLTHQEIEARLDEIIAFSEMQDFIDTPVRTYSSGMYMRLAFSVAIHVGADILLIDEILAVGDAAFQAKCFERLMEIKASGTTIVIVSHSMAQLERICDRTIWIENGKIRMEGAPNEVHPKYLEEMGKRRQLSPSAAAKQEAADQAAKLEGKKLVIRAKAGQGGRLFGAVTPGNVADELEKQFGFAVDKRKLTVSSEMKNAGDYSAEAKLYAGITAKFTVSVVAEDA